MAGSVLLVFDGQGRVYPQADDGYKAHVINVIRDPILSDSFSLAQ